MVKRLAIALYDCASALLLAFVLSCGLVAPAFAYIDPSVMTYTIQAVAGVAVALSAVLGVALRRGRKLVYKLLDVDENAKREFEPAIHRTDGVSANAAPMPETLLAVADESHGATVVPAVVEADSATVVAEPDLAPAAIEAGAAVDAIDADSAIVAVEADTEAGTVQSKGEALLAEAVQGAEVASDKPEQLEKPEKTETPEESEKTGKPRVKKPRSSKQFGETFNPGWKERFVSALIVTAFTVFTIFVFSPLEVVGGSVDSLVFSVSDIWWVVLLPAIGYVVAWSLLASIFRGRGFAAVLAVTFSVGLAAYIQALVLNVGLPLANGDTIVWMDYLPMMIVSALVWVAVITGVIVYGQVRLKRARGAELILATFLFVVQFVGAASLFVSPPAAGEVAGGGGDALNTDLAHRTEVVMTEDQLYTVSPKSNVIVFVLDTYDNAYLNAALKRYTETTKDALAAFTGFTNFKNATSAMIPTRFAVPFMLTGEMPTPDEPFSSYKANRYPRSTFLQEMSDLGYSIGLYSDSLTIGTLSQEEQHRITDLTVNMHKLSNDTLDFGGSLYASYQMALYRDAPWAFKWAFWYYTDSINSLIVKYDPDALPEETIYVMDDLRYYDRLCKYGLSLENSETAVDDAAGNSADSVVGNTADSSARENAGAFRFIHLLGSHYPFNYDEYVNDLGTDGSSVIPQSIGALRIVGKYIQYLKELGVYDQTTIIVTADHGYWTITLDPIEETSTPIMFVKPAQSAELDELPMVDDMTPVSHLDLQSTILEAMGADESEWKAYGYSMLSLDEIPDDRVRLYLTTDSEPDLTDVRLREYAIDGDSQDWSSWSETGRVWSTQE